MKNDAYYAKHCSFCLDIKIFIKSVLVVLEHKNTYKDLSQDANRLDEQAQETLNSLRK